MHLLAYPSWYINIRVNFEFEGQRLWLGDSFRRYVAIFDQLVLLLGGVSPGSPGGGVPSPTGGQGPKSGPIIPVGIMPISGTGGCRLGPHRR
jgi:hypothetical protein